MNNILRLIKKEVLLELRQKHVLLGLLLYVAATVFMVYLMNGKPEAKLWNALFWMVQLFVSVNAIAKSFLQERSERFRYYYTIVSPQAFIIAKILYNIILQVLLCILSIALFSLLLGYPIANIALFSGISFLGAVALSATFTFLSAVASSAQQNAGVVAILGFPLVLPLLMIINKLATAAVAAVVVSNLFGMMLVLLLLSLLIVLLAWILYPMLWSE